MKKMILLSAALFAMFLAAGCGGEKPDVTIIERFSDSCGHCEHQKGVLDSLEKKYGPRLRIIRLDINTEEGRRAAAAYKMEEGGVPSMIFLDRAGRQYDRQVGFLAEPGMDEKIQRKMGREPVRGYLMFVLAVFLGFFAIMNPPGNMSIFIAMTARYPAAKSVKTARTALMTAFGVTAAFTLFGAFIFKFFGITLPAFKVAGGVLVALIGYKLLHGQMSEVQHPRGIYENGKKKAADIAVSPLAVPMLAGPGTIATAMNFAAAYRGTANLILIIAIFGVICLISYYMFIFGKQITSKLGGRALGIINQLMGLIITVIGAQMLLDGIVAALRIR